ncbi:MAG: DUF3850 domain-containing protein [Candidatus Oceanisphaera merdipullorum]|nr:DUF3850 domain-containing protein [Candidatus Oceanisphaera merdipullorum]
MKIHELKIQSQHYNDVVSGIKKAEIRKDDRGFSIGDYLKLNEIGAAGLHTGASVLVLVTHILRGGPFGLPESYCVLSISLR